MFGDEMEHYQRNLGIAAAISLLIYLIALWSEAACRAGDIGFSEELTWARMIEAYRLTTFDHVMRVEMLPMGVSKAGFDFLCRAGSAKKMPGH
jgi:hypothetical protein